MATQSPAVPLHPEELSVSRRQITGDTVQVSVVTHEGAGVVDEMLNHERVEIDRVPIDRPVDAIPPVRQEGETAILPVVEEIIIRTPPYS
jgi:stress response protein YsnF